MDVLAGSTDVTTYVVLRLAADSTEATGLTITNIDLQYVRSGAAPVAKVDATALAATDSAHGDNQAIEIDATDQPGLYRVDWPDAAFAAGVREVVLSVKCATAFTEHIRVNLTPVPSAMQSTATGAITTSSFAAGAIDAAAIADNAIDAGAIAANAITAAKIATDAITADKIAADAIASSELAASAVTEIVAGLAAGVSLVLDSGGVMLDPDKYQALSCAALPAISSAAALPSIPAGAAVAIISIEGANARWRADGATTAPTTTVGHLIPQNGSRILSGKLSDIKIIETTATATGFVTYYGRKGASS